MTQEITAVYTFGIGIKEREKLELVATFFIGADMFGISAIRVQEIVRFQKMTYVPHAPNYVIGLINLRGQIVTAIDLRYRLTGEHIKVSEQSMSLIVKAQEGIYCVIVDDVGDVLEVSQGQLEAPPETMAASMRAYVSHICKLDKKLLNILDADKIVGAE